VQDTFLQAIRSVHRFRGRSTLYTWLYAILLNLTRHYHRDRKRIVYDDDLTGREVCLPDENPCQSDTETASSAIMEALRKLSSAHREVIILRYYEHMKIHEIAAHLGISKGTVKSRLHYAIGEMQKFLPDELTFLARAALRRCDNDELPAFPESVARIRGRNTLRRNKDRSGQTSRLVHRLSGSGETRGTIGADPVRSSSVGRRRAYAPPAGTSAHPDNVRCHPGHEQGVYRLLMEPFCKTTGHRGSTAGDSHLPAEQLFLRHKGS